ncbi:MAG: hypothetical protein NT169_15260 [Chloroflexi bacterium]|nr:hypothetical protein [Chloroflexota bacterium]
MAYNLPAVRQLLTDAFNGDELLALAQDYCPAVYEQFTPGMSKSEVIRLLLDHAGRRLELTRLLAAVQEANPRQYERFAGSLGTPEPAAQSGSAASGDEADRSAGAGFLALLALLEQPDARAAVVAFRTDFEAACQQIGVLAHCKHLHDLFQQLQDRHRLIECDRKRLPADSSAWDSVAINGPELENALDDLLQATGRSPRAGDDVWGIGQIRQARDDLHAAMDGAALPLLNAAVQRLNRILAREPTRVNAQLVATAGALRLSAIATAITAVLNGLPEGEAAVVQQLRNDGAELARLDGDLHGLVDLHDAWQAVGDELARIEGNLGQDTAELELAWPDLETMTARLCGNNGADWAVALTTAGADLRTALNACDPARARRLFQRYRSLAVRRFNQVDQDLLALCETLQKIGEPLNLLLRAL